MERTGQALSVLQKLPLETKEMYFEEKAREFVDFCEKQKKEPVLSFSGGLDSTVAGDILRRLFPGIRFVFSNTGMEFNAIASFARNTPGITVVSPKMNFKQVVEKYGFPAVSKKVSRQISDLQNPTPRNVATRRLWLTGQKRDGTFSPRAKLSDKWLYLIDGPRLSNRCCDILKKEPLKRFAKENNALFFIGERAEESKDRRDAWIKRGCNSFASSTPAGYLLAIATHQDVLAYVRKYDVPYCTEIYGDIVEQGGKLKTTGESGTGCVGCGFGCPTFDPLRYVRLYQVDPNKHRYCMEAGADEVLRWLGMPAYSADGPLCDYMASEAANN